MQGSTNTQV